MKVRLNYKDFEIGELSFNGEKYRYKSLPQTNEFLAQYGFIQFPLGEVRSAEFDEMPHFFAKMVEDIVFNPLLCTQLGVNLNKDSYFDIICRYAKLPQVKDTFFLTLKN